MLKKPKEECKRGISNNDFDPYVVWSDGEYLDFLNDAKKNITTLATDELNCFITNDDIDRLTNDITYKLIMLGTSAEVANDFNKYVRKCKESYALERISSEIANAEKEIHNELKKMSDEEAIDIIMKLYEEEYNENR